MIIIIFAAAVIMMMGVIVYLKPSFHNAPPRSLRCERQYLISQMPLGQPNNFFLNY
jgi:hypothetical protein